MIYLDTHVVIWLYARRLQLLSERVRRLLEARDLLVSPMVLLELDFLREIGRIAEGGHAVYQNLHAKIGLRVCNMAFARIIEAASRETWTRDPFDRIIVGHASAGERELVTRDDIIHQHYSRAFW